MLTLMGNCAELTSSKLIIYIHDSITYLKREVKHCEDTRPGHQLEASSKQHETPSLCRRFKAKKVTLHPGLCDTIPLGEGGSIYTSNILRHLKELGLD